MWSGLEYFAEEPFGSACVPSGAEYEVDRLAGGIDHAIEVRPFPFDFHIGLIHKVRVIGWAQMRAASFL